MLERIELQLNNLKLNPNRVLVVGVSGGPDSLCLIDLLSKLTFPLIAAHFDHGLRPESADEAEFVRSFTKKRNIKCILGNNNVGKYALKNKLSIEEAGRDLRYRFLFELAEKMDAQAVLVAHHADDQVETVLMHLLRGAGLSGLKGMQIIVVNPKWSDTIPIVRPLLMVWRDEIIEYNQRYNLEPRYDQSNLDSSYYRNRLRHELLPYLESYNPKIRQVLWRMADTLSADHEVVDMIVTQAWYECDPTTRKSYVSLNLDAFITMKSGIQRQIIRRAISHMRPGLRNVDHSAVERVLSLVLSPTRNKQQDIIAGLKAEIVNKQLVIREWGKEDEEINNEIPYISEPYKLVLPGELDIGEGWLIKGELLNADKNTCEQAYSNSDAYIAWLDAEEVGKKIIIRRRVPGDRFKPLGMQGHSCKVADFFINVKLPKPARTHWPLVIANGEVIWIPGYCISHPYRITQNTTSIIKMAVYKI